MRLSAMYIPCTYTIDTWSRREQKSDRYRGSGFETTSQRVSLFFYLSAGPLNHNYRQCCYVYMLRKVVAHAHAFGMHNVRARIAHCATMDDDWNAHNKYMHLYVTSSRKVISTPGRWLAPRQCNREKIVKYKRVISCAIMQGLLCDTHYCAVWGAIRRDALSAIFALKIPKNYSTNDPNNSYGMQRMHSYVDVNPVCNIACACCTHKLQHTAHVYWRGARAHTRTR